MPRDTNPHESRARSAKVEAMADVVWSWLTDAERCNPELPCVVAAWNRADRDALAKAAGQHTPSDTTWTALCDRLAVMVERERARRAFHAA